MKYTDHIEVDSQDGRTVVRFRDDELFDLFDDLFVEHDLECEFIIKIPADAASKLHEMHFPSAVSRAKVLEVLHSVPETEIERIFGLNN